MEKLQRLLEKTSWKTKTLGEIATEIYTGSEITRAQLDTGNHPAVKCGDINEGMGNNFLKCSSRVNLHLITKPKYFKHGDILISAMGSQERIGTAIAYLGKEKCLAGNDVIVLRSNQNPKYLSYVLSTSAYKKQVKKWAIPSTVWHLYIKNLKKIRIPIPPIHIQELIANHLDKWTKLENKLTVELKNRRIQYSYYKDLIVLKRVINWGLKNLSEIATSIYPGKGVISSQLNTGNHPAIKNKDINRLPSQFTKCISFVDPKLIKNKKYCERGDLLISNMGSRKSIGSNCIYLGKDKCIAGNHVVVVKHKENPKFLSYILSSQYCMKQIRKYAKGTIVQDLSISLLKKIKVPIPPIKEQERIVAILDKFHRIAYDCKEGIPKLLQQVKKQYEHYKRKIIEG